MSTAGWQQEGIVADEGGVGRGGDKCDAEDTGRVLKHQSNKLK